MPLVNKEKSVTYEEIGTDESGSESVPFVDSGIGTRISELSKRLGTREKAAHVIGMSVPQLRRYISGSSEPPLGAMARLCIATGASLDWLVTGVLPTAQSVVTQSQVVSQQSLTLALQLVEEVVAKHQLPMPPARKAELTLAVAELIEDGVPEAKVLRYVRAAIPA